MLVFTTLSTLYGPRMAAFREYEYLRKLINFIFFNCIRNVSHDTLHQQQRQAFAVLATRASPSLYHPYAKPS